MARLQSEIRVDNYTPHTTPALTKIRELVMEEKLKAESELEKLQGMLNQFEAAGVCVCVCVCVCGVCEKLQAMLNQ